MKRLFFITTVVGLLFVSCGKINDELDALGERLDQLELSTIPSINAQITSINTSIGALENTDKELDGYIKTLQTTASNLQEQINATNTKIDELKASLQGEISTAKTEVLSQLNAVKAELEGELSQINSTIETLQAKDAELDKKIADLRTYVDDELKNATDWAEATFATLEQYNALAEEVAVIKTQITSINNNISALETRLNEKISKDIAAAVSTLNSDIQQKVKSITDAYTEAVKSAKEDITEAYTAAIESAISTLETSMKSWVSEQLKGYYTIAEIDAKVAILNKQIEDGDESLAEELSKIKSSLEAAKKELTEAYEKAIEQAIEEHNGEITAAIASEINSVNQRIHEEVAAINSKLAALQSQVDKNSANISKLLARIQSLSYIPQYEDGKATVKYIGSTGCVTLDFEVSPKDAVAELAKVWQDALSVKAVYTQTRAVSFVDMPIVEFEADAENGVITVVASGENLSAEFINGTQSASARLSISDGNNSVTSEYIPMVALKVYNEICYTATAKVEPYNKTVFGANYVSNEWDSTTGKGVITFDGDVTSIGDRAFWDCSSLISVVIPDSVTSIGYGAFLRCTSLTCVTIGNGVTSIGDSSFSQCHSLTDIVIPDSVIKIEYQAFELCSSLTSVTIPDSVIKIGYQAFYGCTSLTSITISNSVTSIGGAAFYNCRSLTNITIPDSVTSIGDGAFYDCTSLTEVYCKATTPPTGGSDMFDYNASSRKIYVPTASVDAYKVAAGWKIYASDIVGYDFE